MRQLIPRMQIVCQCGKEFLVTETRLNQGRGKYCSKACNNRYKVRRSGLVYKLSGVRRKRPEITDTEDPLFVPYYVYAYLDPRKSGVFSYASAEFRFEPFYIGVGQNDRKDDHLKCVIRNRKYRQCRKYSKIQKIVSLGLIPIILVVKTFDNSRNAKQFEITLIKEIGRIDMSSGPLTNMTSGGDGFLNWSKERREKHSNRHKGRIPWNKGLSPSQEVRDKISKTLTGRKSIPLTEYQKQCISKAQKNKIVSSETRHKLSESHKGHTPWNKGLKGAQVAWNKGLTKEDYTTTTTI